MEKKNILEAKLLSSTELAIGHGIPVASASDDAIIEFFKAHRKAAESVPCGDDFLNFIDAGFKQGDISAFVSMEHELHHDCNIYKMVADVIGRETGLVCVPLLTDLPEPKSYGKFDVDTVREYNRARSLFLTIISGSEDTAAKYMAELGIPGRPSLIYATNFSFGDPIS